MPELEYAWSFVNGEDADGRPVRLVLTVEAFYPVEAPGEPANVRIEIESASGPTLVKVFLTPDQCTDLIIDIQELLKAHPPLPGSHRPRPPA